MNRRLSLYYVIIAALALGVYNFHVKLENSNPIARLGFDCVVKGHCPEKWEDRSGETISLSKFRSLLQIGHQLNALLSTSHKDDELLLSQKFETSCHSFEVRYIIQLDQNKFYLLQAEGLEQLELHIQNLH